MSGSSPLTLEITGMDCADCARTIENGIRTLPGVTACSVNFATATLRIEGSAPPAAIRERVQDLGYGIATPRPTADAPTALPNFFQYLWRSLETRLALLGALLVLPGIITHEILQLDGLPWVDVLSVTALVLAGWPIARSALQALWLSRQVTINLLMSIAAIGAVIIGAYSEAGLVMVLFVLAEALEGYTAERSRHAIRGLMALAPQTATRIDICATCGVDYTEVPVGELRLGDRLLVKPGARLPMDGVVLTGQSAINQAPITGESVPVDKHPGDTVFAGSINGPAALEIEVTRLAEDNTIARLIRLVSEAQENRAPAQRFIDRFATWYTPVVVIVAVLVATLPPLLFNQPFTDPVNPLDGWLYRGLALLVIACPCALVISTPVTLISALTRAAQHGVLFKGGLHLETLSRIRAIAFDKTGTLTVGQPQVVAVQSVNCTGDTTCAACDDLVALAVAVEQRSEHPLGLAVVSEANRRAVLGRYQAANVTAEAGRGVRGAVNGHPVFIGSHTYFDAAIDHSNCADLDALAQSGQTPLLVAADGAYAGYLTVADALRPESAAALADLKSAGVTDLVMLTGDNRAVAQRIAAEVGLTDVRAELLPEDKLAAITALQAELGPVAMVGDGINDAPALAAAHLGIAIGAAGGGSAQAMETADVTLMSADLRRLPWAVRLSRAAMNTIYFNITLAVSLKLGFMLLAVLGLSTMWMAVLADMGASLFVTLNGMRLLGWQRPTP